MAWLIGIGLALITGFFAVLLVLKPTEIGAWLQGFGLVAMLALIAIGERRKRRGRTIWTGVSTRAFTFWNLGLGVFFSVVGVVLIVRKSYLVALFNLAGGLGMLILGLLLWRVKPPRTPPAA